MNINDMIIELDDLREQNIQLYKQIESLKVKLKIAEDNKKLLLRKLKLIDNEIDNWLFGDNNIEKGYTISNIKDILNKGE